MLRVIDISGERTDDRTDSLPIVQRSRAVRLLVVHNNDRRLAALEGLLRDLGYAATTVASAEDARTLLDDEGPPDILITTRHAGTQIRGPVFARECLARFPFMQALYVSWMPWSAATPLGPRERLLPAPFTAACLTSIIGSMAARAANPAWQIVNSA
jgi:hypothetical protein